ncbi:ciga protein [Gigaspora margarita]|uniref:Ciga protein n=1 Tax=Gigaspora margarita TaxID=4874 RepID=A0A8H3XKT1_GIGMA|nr:ciga protein [Gigaspora margarita]
MPSIPDITSKKLFIFFILISILVVYLLYTYLISEYLREKNFESQFVTNLSNSNVLNTTNLTNSDCKNIISNELYLAYLPYGSFHEQRVSLENAIFLAWATNRTLIVPSIIFGQQPLPYEPFQLLSETLVNLKHYNETNSKCEWDSKHNQCIKKVQKNLYTFAKWESLINMEFSQQQIRSINLESYNLTNILLVLNITDQTNEVYIVDDEEIYTHQIYDDVDEKSPSDTKYKSMIHLCSLQRRNETLLHFGSLFGTNRLNLKLNDNREFLQNIRNSLIINHPVLLEKGEEIGLQLGGLASYIGIHFEQMDDIVGNKETFINDVIEKLKNQFGIVTQETIHNTSDRIELAPKLAPRDFQPTLTQMLAEECVQNSPPEKRNYPIIYFATDSTKSDPKLTRFFEEFPCVFMLSNFTDWTETLKFILNPIDNVSLYEFLIPLIDAVVVARSSEFFGKNESLVSNYIQRLHDYWVGA